jgi:hypothetical protein
MRNRTPAAPCRRQTGCGSKGNETAQVTAEEVQAVVEGAEHTHQRGGLFYSEMQMFRRIENQCRIEDGEAERREDLNEEKCSRSFRSLSETACEKVHPAFLLSLDVPGNVKRCQL